MPEGNATQTVLSCYRCGASLSALSLPLSRLDLCPGCSVELHVCRMCTHYAPTAPDACDEEDALDVRDKTKANFCDYFDPNPDAFDGREQKAEQAAKANLDALFGNGGPAQGAAAEADEALNQAEDLFKK